jgi:hypothetical protein
MLKDTNTLNSWTTKKSDGWVVLVYFMLLIGVYHTISSIPTRHDRKRHITYIDNFTSLNHLLLTGSILLFVGTPIVAFKRRVPNALSIDRENRLFTIKSKHKKKDLSLSLDRLYFYHEKNFTYSVFELYVDIDLPNGKILNKRARTILLPNWGMSLNAKTLNEIVQELQLEDVQVKQNVPKRGFWELMGE